jgi:PAS domain S-box-containing protein
MSQILRSSPDRRCVTIVGIVAACCAVFCGIRPVTAQAEPERIIVVGDSTYAPLEFEDANGDAAGVFVDVWRLWSERTGVGVDFRCMVWADAIEAVERGDADAFGGIFYSDERAERFDFVADYMEIPTRIFFHESIFGVRRITDLKAFRVGVVEGDQAHDVLSASAAEIELAVYESNEQLVAAAVRGDVKVFVADHPIALFYLSTHDGGDQFRYAAEPIYIGTIHAAVRKDDPVLRDLVARGFDAITDDEIEAVVERWTGYGVGTRIPWRATMISLGVVALGATLILVWNAQLRRRVASATGQLREEQQRLRASEAELRVSEERYRLASVGTADGMWDWDLQTDEVFYSDRFLELIGRTRDSFPPVIGSFRDLLHPDDADRVREAIERHRRHGEPYDIEYRLATTDGQYRWFRARGQAIWDDEGRPVRMAGSIRDVHERRLTEESLRARATRMARQQQVLIELAADRPVHDEPGDVPNDRLLDAAVRGVDADRVLVLALDEREGKWRIRAQRGAAMHGFVSRDQFEGPACEPYLAALSTRRTVEVSSVGAPPDHVHCRTSPCVAVPPYSSLDAAVRVSGRIVGAVCFVHDGPDRMWHDDERAFATAIADQLAHDLMLSERRSAIAALRESEQKHRVLFESATDGIVILQDGVAVDCNTRAVEIHGTTREHFLGKSPIEWGTLMQPDGTPTRRFVADVLDRVSRGETMHFEWEIVRRDDQSVHCDVTLHRIMINGVPSVLCALRDMTERREAQAELLARAETERLLLSELDHRVRNNLSSLISLVEMSATDTRDPVVFAESVASRIRAMAKVHSLLSSEHWRPVRLRHLMLQMFEEIDLAVVHLDGEEFYVEADKVQPIVMIINELLTNSRKHGALGRPSGRLHIMWSRRERDDDIDEVTLAWREEGGPPVTSSPEPGVGMSLIRGLTQFELRGDASFGFAAEGVHHVFRLQLPRVRSEDAAQVPQP